MSATHLNSAKQFGLIGFPLEHSFSPQFFLEKFKKEHIHAEYHLFQLEKVADYKKLLTAKPHLMGLNVTLPYKSSIMPFLSSCSKDAAIIGAVNCIRINEFETVGYNTDWLGFTQSIKPLIEDKQDLSALILGNGGSAKAVMYSLEKMKIQYKIVSRNAEEADFMYAELNEEIIFSHKIIINTTPIGMSPYIKLCPPIPYDFLTKDHLLYDLIYNPEETLFLKKGREQNATTKNGLEMLTIQAEESWKIWNELVI